MNILEKVLNKFKSYYVNYKVFPRNIAKKMPLYVSYKTKCTGLRKGCITIGSDNMWGWNVVLMDGDGHPIRNKDGEIVNNDCPIYIGNNVWLGSYSRIMKGADIKDGCTVGLGSLVTSENIHENSIIVGVPAVEKRHEMFWDRGEFPDV